MLSLRTIPRNISHYFKQTTLELHTSIKLLSAKDSSSSSSSSDSSDSDADKEAKAPKKEEVKDIPSTNERLNALLQKLSQKSQAASNASDVKKEQKINVAIQSRQIRFQKYKGPKIEKEKPFEEQLVGAAEDVAKTLGGDTQKTQLELLSKVLNLKSEDQKTSVEDETPETPSDLSNLLSNMKIDRSEMKAPITFDERRQKNAGAMRNRFEHPSVAESLLKIKSKYKGKMTRFSGSGAAELKVAHPPFGILNKLKEEKNLVELTTWEKMEEREMKLATFSYPMNVFQELILWTEQGKLWKFPIDNEQGLEEEAKIHFSEHVFMDRHLKGWCPKKGPIRHFMELVCTGLSKNPYMTVQEKIGHIMWYRDYFEDKKDLLQELGLLDNKVTTDDKKQIEA